jgi:Protein of unknown function (DUF1573)
MSSRRDVKEWTAQLCVVLFLGSIVPLVAQLKWESLEQKFKPSPLDKVVVAKYRFTNVGTSPVTISEVRTSCGCTTAALAIERGKHEIIWALITRNEL